MSQWEHALGFSPPLDWMEGYYFLLHSSAGDERSVDVVLNHNFQNSAWEVLGRTLGVAVQFWKVLPGESWVWVQKQKRGVHLIFFSSFRIVTTGESSKEQIPVILNTLPNNNSQDSSGVVGRSKWHETYFICSTSTSNSDLRNLVGITFISNI